MSEANKGKYEVLKVIRDNILMGLSAMGLQPSVGSTEKPWDVMEFAQASFQNADKIVLLNRTSTRRIGFQGVKYGSEADIRTDEWLEEENWQIHVIMKQYPDQPSSTFKSEEDVASLLITWFNGGGNAELRKHGIGTLRVDTNRIFVYNDDSSLYQRRAMFNIVIQVPRAVSTIEKTITAVFDGTTAV